MDCQLSAAWLVFSSKCSLYISFLVCDFSLTFFVNYSLNKWDYLCFPCSFVLFCRKMCTLFQGGWWAQLGCQIIAHQLWSCRENCTFAIGCLFLCWLSCSFLYLMTLICGVAVQQWLVLPLCSRTAACAFVPAVPVLHWCRPGSCWAVVHFTTLLLLLLFIQTRVWATVQASQATALWLFHISLHPAFMLSFSTKLILRSCISFPFLPSCVFVSAKGYSAEDECSPVLFLFWFFTACFSLCTLAGPFCLVHRPAKRFLIPWAKCQSAFVTDFFKPRYRNSFVKSHTRFLIHFFSYWRPGN